MNLDRVKPSLGRRWISAALTVAVVVVGMSGCDSSTSSSGESSTAAGESTFEADLLRLLEKQFGAGVDLSGLSSSISVRSRNGAVKTARESLDEVGFRDLELLYTGTGVLSVDTSPPVKDEHVAVVVLHSPKDDMSFYKFLSEDGDRLVFETAYARNVIAKVQ